MKLLRYGSYKAYRDAQVEANRQKFSNVFADERELAVVAEHFASVVGQPKLGICHGVRNGYEVRRLRERLGPGVIGTDISETAASVPNCIVWDMHEVKPEWLGEVDFIYSNSWDHSYDPPMMFARWASCLSARGILYATWTVNHSDSGVTEETAVDAFGCSLDELIGVLRETMTIDQVLVTQPGAGIRSMKKRVAYARSGRFGDALFRTFARPRMITLACRRRPDVAAPGDATR